MSLVGAAMGAAGLYLFRLVPSAPAEGNQVDWSLAFRPRQAAAAEAA